MGLGLISFTIAALLQLHHHAVSGELIPNELHRSRGNTHVIDMKAQVVDASSGVVTYTVLSNSIHDALDVTMTNEARKEGYSGEETLTYPQVIHLFPQLGKRPTTMLLKLVPTYGDEIIVNSTINPRSIPASDKLRDMHDRNVEEARPCFLTGYAVNSKNSRININTCDNSRMTFKTPDVFSYLEPYRTNNEGYEIYSSYIIKSKLEKMILPFSKKFKNVDVEELPLSSKQLNIDIRVVVDDDVTQRHGLRNIGEWVKYMVKKVDDVFQDQSLEEYKFEIHINLLETVLLRQGDVQKIQSYINDPESDVYSIRPVYDELKEGNPTMIVFLTAPDLDNTREESENEAFNGICATAAPQNHFVVDKGAWTIMRLAQMIGKSLGLTSTWHSSQRENNVMQDGTLPSLLDYQWIPQDMDALIRHRSGYGCLLQESSSRRERVNIYPGELYSLDQQCAIAHGSGYIQSAIMRERPCQVLLCMKASDKQRSSYFVETTRAAVLDGTWCGAEKWCLEGACVPKVPQVPIDGEWSEWGSWSECSRTCGKSLRTRERKCNNPTPSNGGGDCDGENYDTEVCDRPACLREQVNHRMEACRQHNMIASYSHEVDETCKLFCKYGPCDASLPLFENVRDGEPCFVDQPSFGYCRHGRCVMECGEKDQCGVCGSDGSSCQLVTKHVNVEITSNFVVETYGTNAVVIPRGARDVQIRETQNPGNANIFLEEHVTSDPIVSETMCSINSVYKLFHNMVWSVKQEDDRSSSFRARGQLASSVRITLVGLEEGPYELTYSYIISN